MHDSHFVDTSPGGSFQGEPSRRQFSANAGRCFRVLKSKAAQSMNDLLDYNSATDGDEDTGDIRFSCGSRSALARLVHSFC
eukprot:s832_g11.t1